MNADNVSLPILPADSAAPVIGPDIKKEPAVRLLRLLAGLIVIIATFDFCFWGIRDLGFSVAVFCPILAGVILVNRESRLKSTTKFMLMLLMGADLAAMIETGLTNTLVLVILMIVIAGDTFFNDEEKWGRWLSQGIALIRVPGRIFWLGMTLLDVGLGEGFGWVGSFFALIFLTVPALVLLLIFGSLLASGNAVFSHWIAAFFNSFWEVIKLYMNFERISLWCFIAFLALPLLHPVNVSAWWWKWTLQLPRFKERVPVQAARLSSGLILVMLNGLFLVANIADILFLWSGQKLPSGVNYSQFVHQGVNSLIVTVLLSAIVLTTIFQQAMSIVRRPELKILALAWIAQNLFLILSVGLRLDLYIQAYDMTVTRLSVILFLILVASGYALLTIKIIKDRSLSWLIGGCMLAIFATFYLAQFLDLNGWSANYNVMRWEKDRSHNLDVGYLHELGPAAWPALSRAHQDDDSVQIISDDPRENTPPGSFTSKANFDSKHWREWSARAWMNRWALEEK